MRSSVDFQNDAMKCLQMAEETKAPRQKAVLLNMAQAWMLLSEQAAKLKASGKAASETAAPAKAN